MSPPADEYLFSQDKVHTEKRLRQAVALRPQHDQSWNFLILMLASDNTKDNRKSIVAECEERLRHKDTPHNRYLAARAYLEIGQLDKAQRHVEASLRNEPDNILTNLSLTALLLKRADQPAILAQATKQLLKAEMLLSNNPNSEFASEALLLRGIHAALIGDIATAGNILLNLTKNKKNELASKILKELHE